MDAKILVNFNHKQRKLIKVNINANLLIACNPFQVLDKTTSDPTPAKKITKHPTKPAHTVKQFLTNENDTNVLVTCTFISNCYFNALMLLVVLVLIKNLR